MNSRTGCAMGCGQGIRMRFDFSGTVAGDILSPLALEGNSPLEDIFAEKKAGTGFILEAVR